MTKNDVEQEIEQMTKKDAEQDIKQMNICQKLTYMQNDLLSIPISKSGHNKFGGFDYYELDDLLPPILSLCKKYDCTLYFNFPIINGKYEKGILNFINSQDYEDNIIVEVPFPQLEKLPKMNWVQSMGTYQTYLKRYLILELFNVIEDEIIDAMNFEEYEQDNNNSNNNNNVKQKQSKSTPSLQKIPASVRKVMDKCKKEFPDQECNKKLLNKVSYSMFKNKEITDSEREEIFIYLKDKK